MGSVLYRRLKQLFLTAMALSLAVTVLVLFGPLPSAEGSDRIAKHYRGKRLTIIVNYSPGGSTGTWLTMVARHIGRHIPGNPRVLLKFHPGATGKVGARYMVEVARPHGYTIGGLGGGVVRAQAIGNMPKAVDLRKLVIFGGVNEVSISFGRRKIFPDGIQSLVERKPTKRPFFTATTAKDDSAVREYVWMKLLGYKPLKDFKHLSGFPGGAAERYLSVQRGEVDFTDTRIGGFKSSVMPLVKEGIVLPMFQSGMYNDQGKVVRHPAFPNYPTFTEVYEKHVGRITPSAEWEFLEWRRTTESPLRPMVAPAGTPQYLIDALIKALHDMHKDPAYQDDQEKLYGTRAPVHVLGDAARQAVIKTIEGSKSAQSFFEREIKNF